MKSTKFSKMILSMVLLVALAITSVVSASDVNVAVVDVTVPANGVNLPQGGSGPITINLTVTGNQAGTATFEVYRDWTLSGGTFTGSNPQEFTVPPRAGGDPATTFTTSGTVNVVPGHPVGGPFILSVGVFDITNSNTSGAKLQAGTKDNYFVSVIPPLDATPPVITYALSPASPNGLNGWYRSNVSLTWTVTENETASSLAKTGCVDQTITADQAATSYTCSATSAGGSAGPVSVSIKRDATAPSVALVGGPANGSSYFFYSVPDEPTCNASDLLSDLNGTCSVSGYSTAVGTHTVTASAIDNAGNTASASATYTVKKAPVTATAGSGTATYDGDVHTPSECVVSGDYTGDLSCANDPATVGPDAGNYEIAPVVSGTGLENFEVSAVNGLFTIAKATTTTTVTCAAGPFVYTGSPITPCTATVTGPAGLNQSLQVSYSNNINVGTATASASYAESANYLGSSDTETFSILAWTLNGFYQPVDMGNVFNVVKGGSTVPLKFEVFAGSTELTNTSAVKSFTQAKVTCDAGAGTDEIEVTTTGGTSLRYDTTSGQFIQNWKTPTGAGTCYKVTMTTQDGSLLTAFFKLK